MRYNPDIHHRRSSRLAGFDYAQSGHYFVTICSWERQNVFDHPGVRRLAEELWIALERRFSYLRLDAFVVMPDHVHGIIEIVAVPPAVAAEGLTEIKSPRPLAPVGYGPIVKPRCLPTIVRAYKAAVALRASRLHDLSIGRIWQRGYWERVIRDDEELNAIRRYIEENPIRCAENRDNLDALLGRMTGRTSATGKAEIEM